MMMLRCALGIQHSSAPSNATSIAGSVGQCPLRASRLDHAGFTTLPARALLPSAEQRRGAANHKLRLVKLSREQLFEKRCLFRAEHLLGALHHPIVQLAEFVSVSHQFIIAEIIIPMLEIPFCR